MAASRIFLPAQTTKMTTTFTAAAGDAYYVGVDGVVVTLPEISSSLQGQCVYIINQMGSSNMKIHVNDDSSESFAFLAGGTTNNALVPDTGVAKGDFVKLSNTDSATVWSVVEMFGSWKLEAPA